MENRVFLERYRLSVGRNGLPVELHRSPAARTYRAQEIETGREVALTLVSPAPPDETVLERLERQASAAEQINQINIPRLRDFGRENDELIYVGEYCEGHTASAWVAARGPLAIGPALRVALQVVDAMNATAFQRLYHHALNPDNIIFVAGQTVEGDWPPVKVLHWFVPAVDLSNGSGERVDSAARFASPEQLREGKVDVRSEIYSLGATLWFLLTGFPPAAEDAARIARERLRGVPKIVRHLLDRMLRADPAERPQDPVALAAYLQTCFVRVERRAKIGRRLTLPVAAVPRAVEKRVPLPLPIKPLAWAVGGLALIAFLLLFAPWPLRNHRLAAVAEDNQYEVPESLPNEVPVVRHDSIGRIQDASPEESSVAAAGGVSIAEIPRDETVVTRTASPPQTTSVEATENGSSPATFEELPVANAESIPEPAPPAEGEGEIAESHPPESRPSEIASVQAAHEETITTPPNIAANNEPHSAINLPPSENDSAAREEIDAPASVTRPTTAKKSLASKHSESKRKNHPIAEATPPHPRKSHHSRRLAKRAVALPKLRIGSRPAELVGTTSDGRWILSVEESGRRVIVPPPPGYER